MPDNKKSTAKQVQIVLTNRINKKIAKMKQTKIINDITIKDLLDEYSASEKPHIKQSIYYNHQTMVNTLLKAFGNDALVENFTSIVITETLEGLMYGKRNLSSGYVSKYKYFLHKIFDYAVKHSYTKGDPVDKVELDYKSPISGQQIKDKFLKADELKAVSVYAYDHNKV